MAKEMYGMLHLQTHYDQFFPLSITISPLIAVPVCKVEYLEQMALKVALGVWLLDAK